jgi:hypothetical protein
MVSADRQVLKLANQAIFRDNTEHKANKGML